MPDYFAFEDAMRKYPFFVNSSKWHDGDAIERKQVVDPSRYMDPKKFSAGQMAEVWTKRMLWDEYRFHMSVTLKQLGKCAFSGLSTIGFLYLFAVSLNPVFAFAMLLCGMYSGYMYRHAIGKYGNIKIFEDVPVLVPSMDIYKTADKMGIKIR